MKKVLFTATVDSHIELFHLPFLKYFKNLGYEVHVATNGNDKIAYCDKKIVIPFERNPLKINNLKAIIQLKKIIDKEKYDIIHTHTPMGSVVTRLAAKQSRRKNKTRVIYTAHGFHFFKGAPKLNWLLFYPIEKYLSRYTDTLILINTEDYKLAKKKFKKCNDICFVAGVGIDESKFKFKMTKEEQLNLRESLDLKQEDFILIYPAELSNRKNQEWLLKALKDLIINHNDIHLLLPGKDSLNGKIQRLAKELNIEKNIHCLGFRKDVPKLLKISDIAISSSKQEGLPVNIMEAMYVGLPIIATDCRGNRDLVEDNVNGYIINQFDKDNLKNKILELYCNKDKWEKISIDNKKKIKDYQLDKIMVNMKKIYSPKKRILHLLASNIYSGAENVACTIIETLQNEYDMTYCSVKGSIQKNLDKKNINYKLIDKLNRKNIKNVIREYNPDIIHAHDFKASCLVSSIKCKAKIVSHIHQNPKWLSKINFKTILYNLCTKKIAKIIFVSNSVEQEYIFKKNIKDKVTVLYNYVDQKKIIELSKEKYDSEFDIGYFGRLSKEKNPLGFIEIIKLYKDNYDKNITSCMIGNGKLLKECKLLIEKYNLQKNIKLLGFQDNPYKIVKNVKCLIMPSIIEGFGLSAVESMCLNKPVLNSGVGGLKEICQYNPDFICKNNNEYIKKINEILNNNCNLNLKKNIEHYTDLKKYKSNINKIYR